MAGFAGTPSHPGADSVVVRTCAGAARAAALSIPLVSAPGPAWAEDIDIYPVADEFQQEVERTAAEYDEALAAVAQAEADIQENTVRIDELAAKIPEQQERGDNAARSLYKLQQQESGLLQLLFDSGSFYEFLVNVDSLNRISNAHIEELQALASMKTELDTRQVALENARESAVKHAEEADAALKSAQEARLEAQRRAQEEARRQAEEAAAAQAVQAAQAAQAEQAAAAQAEGEKKASEEPADTAGKDADAKEDAQPSDEQSKASAEPEAPAESAPEPEPAPAPEPQPAPEPVEQPTNDGADWTADQAAFINEWSGRIDAYLAGSPLGGQGVNFAKAAWTYGVDPRWSPAISCVESTKGANCFLPHNAWGWGGASWGSWEEAIDAHVAGLARGYGYTISIDNAKKYCPPNWERWYNNTLEQMNMI